jgi:hypothetical protein
MAKFNHGHATAFYSSMFRTKETNAELFNEVAFDKFASTHSIPQSKRDTVRDSLAAGYAAFLGEADYRELDVKSIRPKLEAVAKAAATLKIALDELTPDAIQAMSDLALASLTRSTLPDVAQLNNVDPAILGRSMFENDAEPADFGFDSPTATEEVKRLSELAEGALNYIRANKTGPRPDDSFAVLLLSARIVWVYILEREFILYGIEAGEGVTEADRFCFEIAKAADPDVEPKKIQRAARLASENIDLSRLLA